MADVKLEQIGAALVVTNCDGARRNPLSPEFYAAIRNATDRAAGDATIASVILTGEGSFFCAGGDLKTLVKRREMTESGRREAIDGLHGVIRAIRACPKPVIAAVEGGAAGAGVSLALACDFLIAARGALFTVAYVKAGLVPDGGLTARLAAQLPRPLVSRLCMLGDPVSADRFHDLGMVTELCDPGGAMALAMQYADRLAAGPAQALRDIKALLETASFSDPDSQLDRERDAMARALGSDEAAEGIGAFLSKTKPDFVKLRSGE